ncbi:P-loop containing nucleoside triphosphate hydrolase protein [Eremomyces bilateralis CBS 781.70]|uniref:P-loop containing nucleoside triphosphate hydrolase protein n=1 Tax=Eremomyces bilateralis CBS 781.70 TaxID=1392243 RepID=A0A6G1G640_9PEZI|nr:P-loop containing nucleoside triphosphate hydrolase protein [Eremomyces bilateralis CBS 781.70]KAF1813498.1 P-loop containing nucleoside triphosphate hydrolase protein [Eremomyces bilateralis CBS 781.70]
MGLPKSKNAVGLGNTLMNDRFGKGKGSDMRRGNFQPGAQQGIQRKGQDGETYVTNSKKEASWVKMRSVTEQGDLDEFLSTAELEGTDFTAQKLNSVKIIHRDSRNPYLLTATEERAAVRKQNANRARLTVPRRPAWDEKTTPRELDTREQESFMIWRRGLASLQESDDLLMTPFERNLEVWRQLWRVIERSDLIVQIVDARNPLLFRCEDLEKYVKEVDPGKNNLLLVNKADMMTSYQRKIWAEHFKKAGISFRFFSAELSKERNEAQKDEEDSEDESSEEEDEEEEDISAETEKLDIDSTDGSNEAPLDGDDTEDDSTRIITTDDLEDLFLENAPEPENDREGQTKRISVGLVGYPNVGKSSTINALIGAKKVSVSSTPGKTKHFQTIHLSPSVILVDCPGLVFPNFATTKAELVCNGVLPIDQLREFVGPAGLIADRIPKEYVESTYGIKIPTRPLEEGGTGTPTASEVLSAYARARGFFTTGLGQPDESRAARQLLKDYVKGKLLFCHPPPADPPLNGTDFNRELYDASFTRASEAPVVSEEGTETESLALESLDDLDMVPIGMVQGPKTKRMDKKFFARGQGATTARGQSGAGHLTMPFNYQYTEQGQNSAKGLSGRKQKAMLALEKDIDPADLRLDTKKHFKANKRKAKKKADDD